MRRDIIFLIVVFSFLALLIVVSTGYSHAARFFPLIFITLTMILIVVQLLRAVLARSKTNFRKAEVAPKTDETPRPKWSRFRYLSIVVWIAGLLAMIYLLGHLVSIALFVFIYTKRHGEGWLLAINLSLGAVAIVYFGLIVALGRHLYEGLLFRLFF